MSEFLASAAEKMGVPEALVKRSAEARAKAAGSNTDDVLNAWAGGESAPAAATPPPAQPEPDTSEDTADTPPTDTTPDEPTPEPAAQPAASIGVIEPIAAPTEVNPREALDHPVVISVPTMGIAERTMAAVPRWLAVAFFLVPAFGLLYLSGAGSADAVCDEGGIRLQADFVTGDLQNCDGSTFEGRSTGGTGGAQFIAIGEAQYTGCSGCHGVNGEGGVGPAFGAINAVFTSCLEHIDWVRLGTNGYREQGIATYGDLGKPVGGGGVMPGFPGLTEEQLASVVAFERIRFGGADPEQTFVDCGLVEGEESGDDDPESVDPESVDPDAGSEMDEAESEAEAGLVRRSG